MQHSPALLGHECAVKAVDLVEFLHDVVRPAGPLGHFPHKVSLHNSCHGVRELGLSSIEENAVSTRMGRDKLRRHADTGAEYVTGADAACLMQLRAVAPAGRSDASSTR